MQLLIHFYYIDQSGVATFSENDRSSFQEQVFGRAAATGIAIASGSLPLTTQFELQKQVLAAAPSTKVT